MLYPVLKIDPDNVEGMHYLPPGNLAVIQLNVMSGQIVKFAMLQNSATQDFSMRAWVSVVPSGKTLGTDAATEFWPLPRVPNLCAVYDWSLPVPDGILRTIAVVPGVYILNILNLINAINVFSFTTDVIGLGLV